ncbi:ubiquitin-like protein [Ascodesmis nigricans]|uniref:Ubiquitin-like protein ATG12 n=1 Tax=Ascodesmis nigricans TaxID=341454 RepID=A0A4S2MZH1_9PEZI|nr:ubiquitin-like protein [Ascodesmis nigricans]
MSSSPPTDPSTPQIPSAPSPQLPIAMSTSALLTNLSSEATRALAAVANPTPQKVTVKFRALTSAPALAKDTYKIKTTQRFENVVKFLRDQLDLGDGQGLYTYIGWSFIPALDESVQGLWECFKDGNGILVVCYSLQSAFG